MPTAKHETFSFGGVDSRSNPTNYPPNRALRCVNWSPQESGRLLLRGGYSVPTGPTADGIPIHSAIYYEQFSANYVGPQYLLYGKNEDINILNILTGEINKAPSTRKVSAPTLSTLTDGGTGGALGAGTYYYVVTAIDASGGETTASNELSLAIAANHKPVLTWAAVTGAVRYNIYRGTSSGAETLITGIGSITGLTYTDNGAGSAGPTYTMGTITAIGAGSSLANVQLTTPDTAKFMVGQQVTITGTTPEEFDTVATITEIVDSSNMTVSADVFKLAGTGGGTASQGPTVPNVLVDGGGAGSAWAISAGVASAHTTWDPDNGIDGTTNGLQAKGFGFHIPSTATIRGVKATVSRAGTQYTNPYFGVFGVFDANAQLLKAGSPAGANRAAPGMWPTSPQPLDYGSASDLFGADLSPSDVNNAGFGFQLQAGSILIDPPGANEYVYSIGVTVFYELPSVPLTSAGGSIRLATDAPPVINSTQTVSGNQMGTGNPWGHFRANNRIYLSSGGPWIGRFFQGDLQSWDGDNLRPVGLPGLSSFSNATTGPVVVAVTSSTAGSFTPTVLAGYQFYGAIYNPLTGHVGNRAPLGDRFTIGATQSQVILTGLPNPGFVGGFADPYSEWVLALGMTNDGGEVPYWLVDENGNNVVFGNSATMGTVSIGKVNALQELPTLNDIPPIMDKFARVGTRIFGALSGSPFLRYSNDQADVSNANYVGNPEESWPANQQEPLPTGEVPTAIHSYRLEGWFLSRNNLCIWSQFLLQQGVNPWRGPWPGGCVGQRAFVETPYGPYWLNANLQLCTFMEDGVISVSEEYEAALLKKISMQYIGLTELAYLKDPANFVDQIVVRGYDSSGNPVIVIHSFNLRDGQSPTGQGYEYVYTGMAATTFAGAGFTPRQNVFDANGRERLWAGSKEGFLAQLEDGGSDNGQSFSGDYLGLVSMGPNRPGLVEMEYQGDENVSYSYAKDYSQPIDGFTPVGLSRLSGESSRYGFKMAGEARWVYCRFQLVSHSDDGSVALTDPPFSPMPTYGAINMAVFKTGRERPEGR